MTRFVILTTQRSGSTVLTRTLDEHPDIFCAGELFHESKVGVHHPEWHFPNWKIVGGKQSKLNKLINYPNLKLNAVRHLKRFYKDDGTAKAKGFKLMYSHIKSTPFIWNYITSNNIKVIVLIRSNTFKMALSRYRMEKTGTAHSKEVNTSASTITVPAQPLLQQTLQLQNVNEKLLSLSQNTNRLVLHYEDFENWTSLMQNADEFLNVPFFDAKPVLKKVSRDDWKEEVKNHKEVEDVFKQHKAEKYLNLL
jgi:hypothetical protein